MTDDPPPNPPDADGLQFDRVESTQPIVPSCTACKGPLGDLYYTAGVAKICARCRDGVQEHLEQGSSSGRFLLALLLGGLAALVGGSIWATITYKSEGTVYGIVAIGLGYLIGLAVRKGSAGRGGRTYQVLAIVLTYLGVAIGYFGAAIPELVKPRTAQAVGEKAKKSEGPDAAKPETGTKPVPAGPESLGCLMGLVLIAGVCLGSPVFVAMESPITLLFLAIALWEAWKLNKGVALQLKGPFRVGGGAAGG